MSFHHFSRILLLVLSTHLACGGLSERLHPDGSTRADGPSQETVAQPDAPIDSKQGDASVADVAPSADTTDAREVGTALDAAVLDAAVLDAAAADGAAVDGAVVDGAAVDGVAVDGGASGLVVSSTNLAIMLGYACFQPQAVTVTNVSGGSLPPIGVSLEGASGINSEFKGCVGESLQAGQSCRLQFALSTFSQTGPGQADLVIQAGASQARTTLTWSGAVVGDYFFDASFGPVVVGAGPAVQSFPYVPNEFLVQQFASSLAVRGGRSSAFAIVPNPDDCTQGPPTGASCILQISFQPLAAQAYQDHVIGGAGCGWANGFLRGEGILPYDGGAPDAGALDSGHGIDATPVDAGGN